LILQQGAQIYEGIKTMLSKPADDKASSSKDKGPENEAQNVKSKTPDDSPKDFNKLKGNQGYKDSNGDIWKKDKLHKDHWDISDKKGNKIREVDFNGKEIWPNGPKNNNKKPK